MTPTNLRACPLAVVNTASDLHGSMWSTTVPSTAHAAATRSSAPGERQPVISDSPSRRICVHRKRIACGDRPRSATPRTWPSCRTVNMTQPGPDPDNYPPIDPTEPVPDDPGPLSPDTPETLPPAPVEPMPGPDHPDSVPAG